MVLSLILIFDSNSTFFQKYDHVPNAHTDEDSIKHFIKGNIIHVGDVYVYNRYRFIDIPSNGSVDGIIDAVKRVIPLLNYKTEIIAGHGNIRIVMIFRIIFSC